MPFQGNAKIYVGSTLIWQPNAPTAGVEAVFTGTRTSGTTATLGAPFGVTEGDLLVGCIHTRNNPGPITPPSGWTVLYEGFQTGNNDGNGSGLAVMTRVAESGDPTAWNATLTTSRNQISTVARVSQVEAPTGSDYQIDQGTGGTGAEWPAVTVPAGGAVVLGIMAQAGNNPNRPGGTAGMWDYGSAAGGQAGAVGWWAPAAAGVAGPWSPQAPAETNGYIAMTLVLPLA